jgi:hypothetical protein
VIAKFPLSYSGKPSRFEGRTVVPAGTSEVMLQVIAFDAAGNTGAHERRLKH